MEAQSNVLAITRVEELESLLAVRVLDRPTTKVVIQLAGQDEVENQLLEYKINRYYNACGCGEGKFFIVLALMVFFIQGFVQAQLTWSWYNAGIAFLHCLAGAFLGKAWGQLNAYFKLRKTVRAALPKLQPNVMVYP